MERDTSCYGKIVDIIYGNEYFIRDIPCGLGRVTSQDGVNILDKKNYIGKSIEIDQSNYYSDEIVEISKFRLKSKLIIQNCKRIYPIHIILYYDEVANEFKIKALGNCFLNTQALVPNQIAPINSYDTITFDCQVCRNDHIFIVVFPCSKANITLNNQVGEITSEIPHQSTPLQGSHNIIGLKVKNIPPDVGLSNKWTTHEKDCLRKYLLIYGYGRWNIIRSNSGGVLNEKSDMELKIFSNAFIKTIIELLPSGKVELRRFLVNFVNENEEENEPYILPKRDDWGSNLIYQRAPAWGKRIQLLYRVKLIVEKFKTESKKNKRYRQLICSDEIPQEEKEKLKSEINPTYDHWDNLLNFLPYTALYGQRPSIWWTNSHDIDLLRGTYKYGYANYPLMRQDTKLSFSKLEKNDSFQEFPNADTITRRLKKVIMKIIQNDTDGTLSFDENPNMKEPTGFTLEEKNNVVDYLINFDIPLNSEGKSDWNLLKEKLIERGIISSTLSSSQMKNSSPNANNEQSNSRTLTPQIVEHFVQRLCMISQQVIQLKENGIEEADDAIKEQLDPDDDGFVIPYEKAVQMNKSRNYLYFIRKNIISHNYKLFEQGLNNLIEVTKRGQSQPVKCKEDFWNCSIHDKSLIGLIEEKGFGYLKEEIKSHQLFKDLNMTYEDYMDRINFICEFYRDFLQEAKPKKKKEAYLNTISSGNKYENTFTNTVNSNPAPTVRKKSNKINIHRDEDGNIIYPISINASLRILNLGRIEYERIHYHSGNNLFPIGYKAIREHQSMFHLGERAQYTCEILDGGLKPLYRLTSSEDPQHPIEKESSTACWIVVCKRINELQGNRRSKVTISGTERFGLCDNNVVRLLQSLPNAEKCSKYLMKNLDD